MIVRVNVLYIILEVNTVAIFYLIRNALMLFYVSSKQIQVRTYCTLTKLEALLKPTTTTANGERSHVVYKYTCPNAACNSSKYIGDTTKTFSQRLESN